MNWSSTHTWLACPDRKKSQHKLSSRRKIAELPQHKLFALVGCPEIMQLLCSHLSSFEPISEHVVCSFYVHLNLK